MNQYLENMPIRSTKMLAAVAALAVLFSVWLLGGNRDNSLQLVSESDLVLSLAARSERQKYELDQRGDIFTIYSTFQENYASHVWPRVAWSIKLSNGRSIDWRYDKLVLDWDMAKLTLSEGINAPIPFSVEKYDGFELETHWWLEELEAKRCVQRLQVRLVDSKKRLILAEHDISLVVEIFVSKSSER